MDAANGVKMEKEEKNIKTNSRTAWDKHSLTLIQPKDEWIEDAKRKVERKKKCRQGKKEERGKRTKEMWMRKSAHIKFVNCHLNVENKATHSTPFTTWNYTFFSLFKWQFLF